MRILITGGAGFIGSAVVRQAIKDGHSVLNVDKLTYAGCLENLASLEGSDDYTFMRADICDRRNMDHALNLFQPDAVMHLAAESHVDRSISGPSAFIETNIIGTYTLLEAVRVWWASKGKPQEFRFHHISTDEVFGSLALGSSEKFTEETAYDPRSPYSASKASSDHLVRAWHETYGLPIVVTNCSNNYGPFHNPEKLIPKAICNAVKGKPIPIYGDGLNVRDWLHVEDHARALLRVVQAGRVGRTYAIGGNAECSNIDLIRMICDVLDEKRPQDTSYWDLVTHVEDRAGHDRRYAIDISRIESELGWTPSISLEEGISATVDWYLENEFWWSSLAVGSASESKTPIFYTRRPKPERFYADDYMGVI